MKILLIGEFSGVHNNLKYALQEYGHDVVLMSDGDGYKNFSFDKPITPYKGTIIAKIKNLNYFYNYIKKVEKLDVVQIINPFAIPLYYFLCGLLSKLFTKTNKIVYYSCGTDPIFIKSSRYFNYFLFDNPKSDEYIHFSIFRKLYFKWFINRINSIVASSYTYAQSYKKHPSFKGVIPFAANKNNISYPKKYNSKKPKILLGITRPEIKGIDFISKALEKIGEKHSDQFELKVIKSVSYEKFKEYLFETDILIDQCKSYDYGMSALNAMEKGIIVLSGAEPIAIDKYFGPECPIINIIPDIDAIINILEDLITIKSSLIFKKKVQTYNWLIKYHSPDKIVKSFQKVYFP